ncbi:hypothetical protein ADK61_19455 [Streptomyces sp. XY66]|nr:hypothetical protein ADK61_19455 [Streptomyces sp. XY66]
MFKELLYKVMEVHRILASAYAMLPTDDERRGLQQAGHTSFAAIPVDAVPPHTGDNSVFDTFCLEELKEALTSCFSLNEEAEHLLAEISILSAGDVPEKARAMFEATWDATGAVETTRGVSADAWAGIMAMKPAISEFEAVVRAELGVTTSQPRLWRPSLLSIRRQRPLPQSGD